MLSDFLHRIAREREADARGPRRRRPVAALLRYAVLGAVALSILPASAAASLPTPAQDGAKSQGGAGPKQPAEQTRRAEAGPKDAHVRLPPKINTRPFKDLLLKGKDLYDSGKLDLSRTVELTVEADRNEDGTLANVTWTGSSAGDNPALKELTADAVAALSDSRVFSVFEGPGRVRMGLRLDGQKFTAALAAELDTAERAEQTANVYGLGIAAMRIRRRGTDEGRVWKNMTASASGKQLALKLDMTRAEAGNLLLKQITPN